jgi:peptidoglycan L-alanyl-D-glutamate endopeptidase CwlK
MSFSLSKRSEKNLLGVQPALTAVVRRALELSDIDFTVIEGVRTKARQKQLVAKGASQTMNSRHLTGHAVDIAPFIDGQIRWDWPPFYKLADAMKQAADELGVKLTWGGDWKSFKDGPHFELHWGTYPSTEVATVSKPVPIDEPVAAPNETPKASPFAALFKAILSIFKK